MWQGWWFWHPISGVRKISNLWCLCLCTQLNCISRKMHWFQGGVKKFLSLRRNWVLMSLLLQALLLFTLKQKTWTWYEVLHIRGFQGNFCFDYNRLGITGQSQPWDIAEQVLEKTYWKILGDSRKQGEPADCNLIGIQVSGRGLFFLFLISVCSVALKGEIPAVTAVLCRRAFWETWQ